MSFINFFFLPHCLPGISVLVICPIFTTAGLRQHHSFAKVVLRRSKTCSQKFQLQAVLNVVSMAYMVIVAVLTQGSVCRTKECAGLGGRRVPAAVHGRASLGVDLGPARPGQFPARESVRHDRHTGDHGGAAHHHRPRTGLLRHHPRPHGLWTPGPCCQIVPRCMIYYSACMTILGLGVNMAQPLAWPMKGFGF